VLRPSGVRGDIEAATASPRSTQQWTSATWPRYSGLGKVIARQID
jgi:hypothetical protein